MHNLASVKVGGSNPVRIMGIINTSPESFYKKSIFTEKRIISKTAKSMEEDGADFIDVGGMSTAPYIRTLISEEKEIGRVTNAIEAIQKVSRLPISIDTCRAAVAKAALDLGVEIVNDVSGLKYDEKMIHVLEEYTPSVILCAFGEQPIRGNHIIQTQKLIDQSVKIALRSGVSKRNIVVDPAIGFFRKKAQGVLFTRISSDWLQRDLVILNNLNIVRGKYPILVSVSRKSFLGELLSEPDPQKRLYGSLAAETFAVLHGADIIRTHHVKATSDATKIASDLKNIKKGL
ncbi:Dihydropteroate synthase [Nitrosotalea sinensis]|uniref:dihydropteroate synthase n=1 Tax=Nitrosotalea sinensis TaxID=1499975 RepID=A0A2H1EGJ4_9ARCH|nr:dihydropteroate synthase [Candidatus Nitrosotalea sinensis]SHO44144.1 Dihydropteroate synthase [Candidatus Nitrosotalea sinensis]